MSSLRIAILSVVRKRKNLTLSREPLFSFYGPIHSYPNAFLRFLFVTGLAKKLYKILHTLSVGFFQNTGSPQYVISYGDFLNPHSPSHPLSIFKNNSACLFTVLATRHCTPPMAKQMI